MPHLRQGCVVAGYPGTPSSEVTETGHKPTCFRRRSGHPGGGSTNEKSAELLAGASYCGARRTLFTLQAGGPERGKHPLMSLNYGVKGGKYVLFVADDPGPSPSQTEQDTRRFGTSAKVPVLDPATPDQAST